MRIARDSNALSDAQKQVAVARWLEDVEYPAVRAVDLDQPVVAAGRVATIWKSVSEREEYAPIEQVAELIRRLHSLDALPSWLDLPTYDPFRALSEKLEALSGIASEDVDFIRESGAHLRNRYDRLEFSLPPGPIHGDANVGNVILSGEGCPILIDLDSFSTGPREWDLVQTALFYDRFGWHSEEEYRKFVEVYGFDIMTWPGYPVLAGYRELSMTTWLAGKAAENEAVAAEVHKRVEALRTSGSRRDWAPF